MKSVFCRPKTLILFGFKLGHLADRTGFEPVTCSVTGSRALQAAPPVHKCNLFNITQKLSFF